MLPSLPGAAIARPEPDRHRARRTRAALRSRLRRLTAPSSGSTGSRGVSDRVPVIEELRRQARAEEIELLTSVLSKVEVAFGASERTEGTLDAEVEARIDNLRAPGSPIKLVEFFELIGDRARSLMRQGIAQSWGSLKPMDATNLATAICWAVARCIPTASASSLVRPRRIPHQQATDPAGSVRRGLKPARFGCWTSGFLSPRSQMSGLRSGCALRVGISEIARCRPEFGQLPSSGAPT